MVLLTAAGAIDTEGDAIKVNDRYYSAALLCSSAERFPLVAFPYYILIVNYNSFGNKNYFLQKSQ